MDGLNKQLDKVASIINSFRKSPKGIRTLTTRNIDQDLSDAFDQLVSSLTWYESQKKIFTRTSYVSLGKKHNGAWSTLEGAGMSYEKMGQFVYEFIELDGSGRFQHMLGWKTDNSEWLARLKQLKGIKLEKDRTVSGDKTERGEFSTDQTEGSPGRVGQPTDGSSEAESESGEQDEIDSEAQNQGEEVVKPQKPDNEFYRDKDEERFFQEGLDRMVANKSREGDSINWEAKSTEYVSTPIDKDVQAEFLESVVERVSERLERSLAKVLEAVSESRAAPNRKKNKKTSKRTVSSSSSSSDSSSEQSSDSQDESSRSSDSDHDSKRWIRRRKGGDEIERLVEALQLNSVAGDKDLSYLDGKVKDPGDWFRYFEKHASVMGWSESTMGKKVVRYLKKEAEGVWRDMKEKNKSNYKKIKKAVIRDLTPPDAYYVAKKDFIETAQREDESVRNFSRRVKKVARKAGMYKNGEERLVAEQFVRGIRREIGTGMVAQRPKTLENATKLAKRIEESLEAMSNKETQVICSITGPAKPKTDRGEETMGNVANQPGASKDFSRNDMNDRTRPAENRTSKSRDWMESVRCYSCNEIGHLANACPSRVQCVNCSMRGHVESDCRRPKNV